MACYFWPTLYISVVQPTARGPHAARGQILCGPRRTTKKYKNYSQTWVKFKCPVYKYEAVTGSVVAVAKKANLQRHYTTMHSDFEKITHLVRK